jgi:hypothetical protein
MIGHGGSIAHCSFSRDNQLACSASFDGTVKVWRRIDGSLVRSLQHTETAFMLEHRPDAHHNHLFREECNLPESLLGCDFSPDASKIVMGGLDNIVRIYALKTGALLHTIYGHFDGITACRYARDSLHVMTASLDCTVKQWRVEPSVPARTRKPRILEFDVTECTLKWFEPEGNGLRISKYVVIKRRRQTGDFGDMMTFDPNPYARHGEQIQKIKNLLPGEPYEFKVCAANANGLGEFSPSSEVQRLKAGIPKRVTSAPKIINIAQRSLVCSWFKPNPMGSKIQYFTIQIQGQVDTDFLTHQDEYVMAAHDPNGMGTTYFESGGGTGASTNIGLKDVNAKQKNDLAKDFLHEEEKMAQVQAKIATLYAERKQQLESGTKQRPAAMQAQNRAAHRLENAAKMRKQRDKLHQDEMDRLKVKGRKDKDGHVFTYGSRSHPAKWEIDHLLPGRIYQLRIRCRNNVGKSKWSPWSLPWRTVAAIPEIPDVPVIKDTMAHSISLEYTLPCDNGEIITDTYVHWTTAEHDIEGTKVEGHQANEPQGSTITGLPAGRLFMVRISVKNVVGASDFTAFSGVMKTVSLAPNKSNAPVVTSASFESMQLRAFLPLVNNGDLVHTLHIKIFRLQMIRSAKVRTYQRELIVSLTDVEVEDSNVGHEDPKTSKMPKSTLIDVDSLRSGTWYEFSCAASNAIGQSEFSDLSNPERTDETVLPDQMRSPTVTDITNRTVTVSWDPPPHDGGAIILIYILERWVNISMHHYQSHSN